MSSSPPFGIDEDDEDPLGDMKHQVDHFANDTNSSVEDFLEQSMMPKKATIRKASMSASDTESSEFSENITVQIIREVEKRPGLYDRWQLESGTKKKLWQEVCAQIYPNWESISANVKAEKEEQVRKRWKNVRDYFQKEINAQNGKPGARHLVKKKRYVYFDCLQFLLNTKPQRKRRTNISKSQIEYIQSSPKDEVQITEPKTLHNAKHNSVFNLDLTDLDSVQYDEDINFTRMLVPMLRKLNEDQKHYAKVQMLNVLRKAKSFPFAHSVDRYEGRRSSTNNNKRASYSP